MKTQGLLTVLALVSSAALAESITVNGGATVQLDATKTIDSLALGTDSVLDLNGYDLTLNGTFAPDSTSWKCMVTNSAATLATIDITPQHDIKQQFQMLKFGGNLKLVVHGNGKLKSNGSFQGVHSSHTGGTVLDAFYYSDRPRFTTADAFGKGPLTLMNGSQVRLTTTGVTADFTEVIAGTNNTDNENYLQLEKPFTFTGPIKVPEDCALTVGVGAGASAYLKGDMSDVRGKISFSGNSNNIQLQHKGGLPNAAQVVFKENTQVRWSGDRSKLTDETLEVASLETESTTNNVIFVNTTNAGQINLRVGANNRDTSFYGTLKSDAYPNKDWRLTKVGTGTLTLGGHNTYGGTTTISGGAIRLVDEGTLGETSRNAGVYFDGGSLEIGAGDSNCLNANLGRFNSTNENPILVKVLGDSSQVLPEKELMVTEDTILSNGVAFAGMTLKAEPGAELTFKKIWLAPDSHLELNGVSLATGYAALTNDTSGIAYVHNADTEHTSTFTAGLNNYAYNSNTKYQLSGNVRYVITGNQQVHLPDSNNSITNTHTGGTVLSNLTKEVRFYGKTSIGNGPVVFYGPAKLSVPSNYLRSIDDYQNLDNPIEVHGTSNTLHLEGPSWGAAFNLTGAWTGDGTIELNNGFHPTINLNGDMSEFAGTLTVKDSPNSGDNHVWVRGLGMPNATLKMEATKKNRLSLKPNNGDALADGTYPSEYTLGNLVSSFDEPLPAISNVFVRGCIAYNSNFTLKVGYLNEDGIYAGDFETESNTCTMNIEKVGTGTWTLKGTNTVLKGTLKVSGGKVVAPKGVYTAEASTMMSVAETTNTFFPNALDTTNIEKLQSQGAKGDSVTLLTVEGEVAGLPSLTGTMYTENVKGKWKLHKSYNATTGQTTFSVDWMPKAFVVIIR